MSHSHDRQQRRKNRGKTREDESYSSESSSASSSTTTDDYSSHSSYSRSSRSGSSDSPRNSSPSKLQNLTNSHTPVDSSENKYNQSQQININQTDNKSESIIQSGTNHLNAETNNQQQHKSPHYHSHDHHHSDPHRHKKSSHSHKYDSRDQYRRHSHDSYHPHHRDSRSPRHNSHGHHHISHNQSKLTKKNTAMLNFSKPQNSNQIIGNTQNQQQILQNNNQLPQTNITNQQTAFQQSPITRSQQMIQQQQVHNSTSLDTIYSQNASPTPRSVSQSDSNQDISSNQILNSNQSLNQKGLSSLSTSSTNSTALVSMQNEIQSEKGSQQSAMNVNEQQFAKSQNSVSNSLSQSRNEAGNEQSVGINTSQQLNQQKQQQQQQQQNSQDPQHGREQNLVGVVVNVLHRAYATMLNVQLGIRVSIERVTTKPSVNISLDDFSEAVKFILPKLPELQPENMEEIISQARQQEMEANQKKEKQQKQEEEEEQKQKVQDQSQQEQEKDLKKNKKDHTPSKLIKQPQSPIPSETETIYTEKEEEEERQHDDIDELNEAQQKRESKGNKQDDRPYDFKFKDYAPFIFRKMRERFGVDPNDYILSLCGNESLYTLPTPGKSSAFFFYSSDQSFLIKTMTRNESQFMRQLLPAYYKHTIHYRNTNLVRIYGMHRLRAFKGKKVYFIVMSNICDTDFLIHQRYDLKGSSYGRSISEKEIKKISEGSTSVILKDKDVHRTFCLGPNKHKLFHQQLQIDVNFMQQNRIMDYSLLLAVHKRSIGGEGGWNRVPFIHYQQLLYQQYQQQIMTQQQAIQMQLQMSQQSMQMQQQIFNGQQQQQKYRRTSNTHGGRNRRDSLHDTQLPNMPQQYFGMNMNYNQYQMQMQQLALVQAQAQQQYPNNQLMQEINAAGGINMNIQSQFFPRSANMPASQRAVPVQDRFTADLPNGTTLTHPGFLGPKGTWVNIFQADSGGMVTTDDRKVGSEPGSEILFVGVIDILTRWNGRKKAENLLKRSFLRQDGKQISAVSPEFYGERFLEFMRCIFVPYKPERVQRFNFGFLKDSPFKEAAATAILKSAEEEKAKQKEQEGKLVKSGQMQDKK